MPGSRENWLTPEPHDWLGGRLRLLQSETGHRVGADAALLAAAAAHVQAQQVVDLGAGVGAVGLALAAAASVALVDDDPAALELAARNAALNGLSERVRLLRRDVLELHDGDEKLPWGLFDLVVTNPPFYDPGRMRTSPDEAKARAHVLMPRPSPLALGERGGGEGTARPSGAAAHAPDRAGSVSTHPDPRLHPSPGRRGGSRFADPLAVWIRAAAQLLKTRGTFVMIHVPEALERILAACSGGLGSIAILPVHPKTGAPAKRILIKARKGGRAPLQIQPGLVLHEASGAFTPEADAIFRGARSIDWD